MARLRYNPPSSLLPSRAVAIRVKQRMEGCALPRKRRLDEIVVAAVDAVSSISTSTSSRDGFSVCCGVHRKQRIHIKVEEDEEKEDDDDDDDEVEVARITPSEGGFIMTLAMLLRCISRRAPALGPMPLSLSCCACAISA